MSKWWCMRDFNLCPWVVPGPGPGEETHTDELTDERRASAVLVMRRAGLGVKCNAAMRKENSSKAQ